MAPLEGVWRYPSMGFFRDFRDGELGANATHREVYSELQP